jgi:hypothetical protein
MRKDIITSGKIQTVKWDKVIDRWYFLFHFELESKYGTFKLLRPVL